MVPFQDRANWIVVQWIWWSLLMLTGLANLVLLTASFFTGKMEWLGTGMLAFFVFYSPYLFADFARTIHAPKPRTSPRVLLARWPVLLLLFVMLAVWGWFVWLVFGKAWIGILSTFSVALPLAGLSASLILMEPGPKKERVYLACLTAVFTVPMPMLVAFALIYGLPWK